MQVSNWTKSRKTTMKKIIATVVAPNYNPTQQKDKELSFWLLGEQELSMEIYMSEIEAKNLIKKMELAIERLQKNNNEKI